ncbi:kinase-like domain-containing protein, partial [Mycena olivaceomarginata]
MFQAGADLSQSRLVTLLSLFFVLCYSNFLLIHILQQFCREALVWQTLRHKYILPLIGVDRETFPSSFCMLLQIAEGLAYLHSMKIVHGDLRGANILISDDWTACLADFGLTGVVEDPASTTGGALTLRWFAPELIAPTFFGCERFVRTTASDVYAFACVCLELHTGNPPFFDVSPDVAAMLKVVAGERPSRPASISDDMWDLITAAWAQNRLDRPSIETN